jgi:hypothetical protein
MANNTEVVMLAPNPADAQRKAWPVKFRATVQNNAKAPVAEFLIPLEGLLAGSDLVGLVYRPDGKEVRIAMPGDRWSQAVEIAEESTNTVEINGRLFTETRYDARSPLIHSKGKSIPNARMDSELKSAYLNFIQTGKAEQTVIV